MPHERVVHCVENKKMKFIIAYVTDNYDLYTEDCKTQEEVDAWLEENDMYEAVVIKVSPDGNVEKFDRT